MMKRKKKKINILVASSTEAIETYLLSLERQVVDQECASTWQEREGSNMRVFKMVTSAGLVTLLENMDRKMIENAQETADTIKISNVEMDGEIVFGK